MLRFGLLVVKNIRRNAVRSGLTAFAIMLLAFVFTIVITITAAARLIVNKQANASRLIVSERWTVPSFIPLRTVDEIVDWPQVDDWTTWSIYTGFFDDSGRQDRMAVGIGTRAENVASMHDGLEVLEPDVVQELCDTKSGALVGESILSTMGWKAGDEFTMISTTHPGMNLTFRIVGALPGATWSRIVVFNREYLIDSVGDDVVNSVLLRVGGPEQAGQYSEEVARRFRDRELQLKVETEAAGVARFVGRSQSLLRVFELIVAVLLIDMILVLGNSISIAVRQRRTEFAVFKCLGFSPAQIFGLVMTEAVILGGMSGCAGAAAAWLLSESTVTGQIAVTPATEVLLAFPVPSAAIIWGILIGIATGILSSLAPAFSARSIKVANVFSRL